MSSPNDPKDEEFLARIRGAIKHLTPEQKREAMLDFVECSLPLMSREQILEFRDEIVQSVEVTDAKDLETVTIFTELIEGHLALRALADGKDLLRP
jgi:hypothetical protein